MFKNLSEMATEYMTNIKIMEKKLAELKNNYKKEKGLEKKRKLNARITCLEDTIFESYKDYYAMLNYEKKKWND